MKIHVVALSWALLAMSCATTSAQTCAGVSPLRPEPSNFVDAVCPLEDSLMPPRHELEAWQAARSASSWAWQRDPADRQAAITLSAGLVHAVQAENSRAACEALFAVANYSYQPCSAQSHQVRGLMLCQLGRLIESCRQSTEAAGIAGPDTREEMARRAIHDLVFRPCRPGEPGYRP